ncbi:MAG: DUF1080 domain-containing protein, partial [Acidobacteriota bacterium]
MIWLLLLGLELFDGKSLKGWYWTRGGAAPAPSWEARGGVLRTTPGVGKEVYLLSEAEFEDFDFSFEWRAEAGANSGIKYRIQMYGESGQRLEPVGLEYQITDDERNADALSTPRHAAGAIYDYVAPRKGRLAAAEVWHRGRIVVRGLHVEHWLDGERVVNVDLDSAEAEASFQQSKR